MPRNSHEKEMKIAPFSMIRLIVELRSITFGVRRCMSKQARECRLKECLLKRCWLFICISILRREGATLLLHEITPCGAIRKRDRDWNDFGYLRWQQEPVVSSEVESSSAVPDCSVAAAFCLSGLALSHSLSLSHSERSLKLKAVMSVNELWILLQSTVH
jgi:hypothetical protein